MKTMIMIALALCVASIANAGTGKVTYTEPPDADLAECQVSLRAPESGAILLRSEAFPAAGTGEPVTVEFPIDDTLLVLNELQTVEVFLKCSDIGGSTSASSNVLTFTAPAKAPEPPVIQACEFTVIVNGVTAKVPCLVVQ